MGACDGDLVCVAGLCVPPSCGDGVVSGAEECDQGPMNSDTGFCKTDCTLQVCGDGFVGPDEGCDDGNMDDTDGCLSDCTLASCGDGIVQAGEECDDGPDNQPGAECRPNCRLNVCGDGDVWVGVEACDDTNPGSLADGCTADCLPAPGGATLDTGMGGFDTTWRLATATNYSVTNVVAEEPNLATYTPQPLVGFREVDLRPNTPVTLLRTWARAQTFAITDQAGKPGLAHGGAVDAPYFLSRGSNGTPELDDIACPADTWLVGFDAYAGDLIDALKLRCASLDVVVQNGAYTVVHGQVTTLGKMGGPGGGAQPSVDCPDGWVAGEIRVAYYTAGHTQVGIKCHRVVLTDP